MTRFFASALVCFISITSFSQTPAEVIDKVFKAQQQLKTVAYTLQRIDTFVTGDTRITNGEVTLQVVPADSVFGCWFRGKRDDVAMITIYDGQKSMDVNSKQKTYSVNTNAQQFPHLPGAPGGQMLLTDLVKLDTTKNTGFILKQDEQYYYLIKHMPDIKEYDVSNRYTVYTISKKSMLPLRRKSHQETLGKVQDLNYIIKDLWINDAKHAFDFGGEWFPADYALAASPGDDLAKTSPLLNKPAPGFQLQTLNKETVQLQQLKGKVVLLDFLEVWCGPCFASVPKIQALKEKYKKSGLQVYGVSFEKKQADAMKRMIEKFKVDFPVLMGDEETRKLYDVNAIPRYVLIDKTGNVNLSMIGFSDELEKAVVRALND